MPFVSKFQEVNPSLADAVSVQQTVAVGCSLLRSALGGCFVPIRLSSLCSDVPVGETLL